MSGNSSNAGLDQEHFFCPVCTQYGVRYPNPETPAVTAHCVECNTDFPYVEECAYCHQPVFLTMSWDQDRQGPPHHKECYEGELESH